MAVFHRAHAPMHNMGTLQIMRPLNLIVAIDEMGGFGKGGKIPWHFAEDFKHFKETTKDSICIMGRRTYTDMLDMVKAKRKSKKEIVEILPNRKSIVLTRNADFKPEGATIAASLVEAVQSVEGDNRDIFILGGEKLFIEALPWVSKIYMTIVQDIYNCDRFLPLEYIQKKFNIIEGRKGEDEQLLFVELQRIAQ